MPYSWFNWIFFVLPVSNQPTMQNHGIVVRVRNTPVRACCRRPHAAPLQGFHFLEIPEMGLCGVISKSAFKLRLQWIVHCGNSVEVHGVFASVVCEEALDGTHFEDNDV
eukprot:5812901-Amphidinium_carterae.1